MKDFAKNRMFRATAVMLCSAGLVMSAAMAQQESAPPPPPDGQQQGPPPDGQMQMQGPMREGHRGMDPDRRARMMQRRLNLSDSQTAQVREIFSEARAKMEAMRSDTALAPEERRAQMMTLHQGVESRIHAVLTPEQQAQYDAMMQRMRERRRDGRGQEGPPPPPPAQPQEPQQ